MTQTIYTDVYVGKSRVRFPMKSLDVSIDLSFQPHYGPEVGSTSNRNEYQKSSWGINGCRRVKLTSTSSACRFYRKCGSLEVSQLYGPPRPATGSVCPCKCTEALLKHTEVSLKKWTHSYFVIGVALPTSLFTFFILVLSCCLSHV
jgi:hypothetical protein